MDVEIRHRPVGHTGSDLCLAVDQFLEFFAGLEICNSFGRNIHRSPGFWIAALSRISFADTKTAEAAEFDLLTGVERFNDAVQNDLDQLFRVLFRHISLSRDPFNQISFCHF